MQMSLARSCLATSELMTKSMFEFYWLIEEAILEVFKADEETSSAEQSNFKLCKHVRKTILHMQCNLKICEYQYLHERGRCTAYMTICTEQHKILTLENAALYIIQNNFLHFSRPKNKKEQLSNILDLQITPGSSAFIMLFKCSTLKSE